MLGEKTGLASLVMISALVFSAEQASAGIFDKLNESLDAVTADMDKVKAGVDDTQAKLDETKAQIDEAKSELDDTRAKLDATKAKGSTMVDDAKKGLANLSED